MKDRNIRRLQLLIPLSLLVCFFVAYRLRDGWLDQLVGLYPDKLTLFHTTTKLLLVLLLLLSCWSILSFSNVFIWRRLERRNGRPIPRLLTGIYSFLCITLTSMALLILVFDQSIVDVSVITGGLILIVFIFFRDFLRDMMAGLSIISTPP